MGRVDPFSYDLFGDALGPGSLECSVEIASAMAAGIKRAREKRGMTREIIASEMTRYLRETISEGQLDAYTSPARDKHQINLRRAMAFDAALGDPVLLTLYAKKIGGLRVISEEDAAYIELGRIHQEEKELAERKRALQIMLKAKGNLR